MAEPYFIEGKDFGKPNLSYLHSLKERIPRPTVFRGSEVHGVLKRSLVPPNGFIEEDVVVCDTFEQYKRRIPGLELKTDYKRQKYTYNIATTVCQSNCKCIKGTLGSFDLDCSNLAPQRKQYCLDLRSNCRCEVQLIKKKKPPAIDPIGAIAGGSGFFGSGASLGGSKPSREIKINDLIHHDNSREYGYSHHQHWNRRPVSSTAEAYFVEGQDSSDSKLDMLYLAALRDGFPKPGGYEPPELYGGGFIRRHIDFKTQSPNPATELFERRGSHNALSNAPQNDNLAMIPETESHTSNSNLESRERNSRQNRCQYGFGDNGLSYQIRCYKDHGMTIATYWFENNDHFSQVASKIENFSLPREHVPTLRLGGIGKEKMSESPHNLIYFESKHLTVPPYDADNLKLGANSDQSGLEEFTAKKSFYSAQNSPPVGTDDQLNSRAEILELIKTSGMSLENPTALNAESVIQASIPTSISTSTPLSTSSQQTSFETRLKTVITDSKPHSASCTPNCSTIQRRKIRRRPKSSLKIFKAPPDKQTTGRYNGYSTAGERTLIVNAVIRTTNQVKETGRV
ncbi:hypothetical protein ABW20_dc0100211 [Dactylellina cionopaga]|nr:hypothetical protein ABW20_dc0100211 [Dactylellina cionopaga]